jgi:hypothetical protein
MVDNLMSHTVNVNSPTTTKGTSGGLKEAFSAVYAGLPCSIQPVSSSWLVRYAQRHIDVSHTLYFNQALTILIGDQIVFGARTFLVEGKRDLIEAGRVTVVDCKELL